MSLLERLRLEHPIVQAGMGGGIAGGELAGAVSAVGGLGTVGILPPRELRAGLERARELAGGAPVAANLLLPFTRRRHVEACAAGGAAAVVLHAGFDRRVVEALNGGGAMVLQTVGTPAQPRRALADGVDGLVVQGREAGGHLMGVEPALDALPRILEVTGDAPVLLAGGVADRSDARRALEAGAAAVVAGTRFLLTPECHAHPEYKRRVLAAQGTLETTLFGLSWPMRHRVVPNPATQRWCDADGREPRALAPVQALSRPLARLPLRLVRGSVRTQRPDVPLFGPAAPVRGMPERLVDATALYAGQTALRIDSIVPARRAVEELAGVEGLPASRG